MNHSSVEPEQSVEHGRDNRVHIVVEEGVQSEVEPDYLEEIALSVLEAEQVSGGDISVLVSDNSTVQELNARYRGKDEPTDVLSFVASESPGPDTQENSGDIVISVSSVAENAERFRVSVAEELCRVLIHGVLHICGWNHTTNDDDEPMLRRQEALLRSVGREHIK